MDKKSGERARVLQLRARNVKSIREVAISDVGDIHEIRGDAGQGKTGILEAIEGALRGLDPDMVRNGADKAEIELVLNNAQIHRVIPREGKESLFVRDGSGNKVAKAKDFLAAICDASAFRPVAWVQLSGGDKKGQTERRRQQRDMLLEALPLQLDMTRVVKEVKGLGEEYVEALAEVHLDDVDCESHAFVVCEQLRRACYEYRRDQNAAAEQAEKKLEVTPAPERPAPRMSEETCALELKQATEAYHAAKARQTGYARLKERRDQLAARIEAEDKILPAQEDVNTTRKKWDTRKSEAQAEVHRLEKELAAAREALSEADAKVQKCKDFQERLDDQAARKADLAEAEEALGDQSAVDLDALRAAMDETEADLAARRLQDTHDAAAEEAVTARERAELFTGLVKLFRDEVPKALVAEADLPIENLSVDADQILVDGVPLHQLGTSQQIRVGVLVAAALNPRSGFVLVDGAESLGRKDRLALAEVAEEQGLQLIMTYVDPDAVPKDGVTVMEDGEAKVA